jgi:hypothetical protein
LLSVVAVPVLLAVGMAVAAWGFGATLGPDLVAMFMMIILMFSAIIAQSLGPKALEVGPRAVAQQLGWALGMFGMLIVGKVPPADMALDQLLQDWLWFPGIVFLGLCFAIIKPLRALRRHPRGLWILARRGAITVVVFAMMAVCLTWWRGASPAQGVWAFLVTLAAGSSGAITFGAHSGKRRTRLGKFALAMAEAVPFSAMLVVVIYVFEFGGAEGLAVLPFGTIVGASIVFLGIYFGQQDEHSGAQKR